MKKLIALISGACCALVINVNATTQTVQVGLGGPVFSPSNFSICLGDTVLFVWASGFHNVHITNPPTTPSPDLSGPGNNFKFIPVAVGVHAFQCDYHFGMGMTGTFTVNGAPIVNLGADVTQCGGSVLLNAGNTGASYVWTPSGTTQTITALSTGTYSVNVTNSCGTASDGINVLINTPPNVNLGSDVTQCGGSVILNAGNPGAAYAWTPAAATQTVSATSTGTYSVVVTDANNCSASDAVFVLMQTVPVVNLGADVTQCGGSVLLNAGNSGVAYAWTPSGTTQIITALSTGTFSVDVTNSCGTVSDAIDITINTPPAISVSGTNTICIGQGITLTASGANTYVWSPSGSLSNSTSANPEATPTISTNYTVTGTGANGCTNTFTYNVTVNPIPAVTLGNDVTQCGGSVILNAGNPGDTYVWSEGSTTQIITAITTGTYSVVVSNGNGCMAYDTINVTINSLPVITINGNTTICSGSNTTLCASGGSVYLWNIGQTNMCVLVSPTVTTSYTVVGTSANGCSNTAIAAVTIGGGPSVSTTSTPTSCSANAGTAMANPSGGVSPYTFIWTGGQTTQTATGLAAGMYTVTVTDAAGCFSSSVASVVTSSGGMLTTTFAGGNNHRGNMFDLTALSNITLVSVDAHPAANTSYEIYYHAGTYVGTENNSGAWTLAGSAANVIAQPSGTPTPIPIALNITIPAGQTYALYVTSSNIGVSQNYTDGTAVGNVFAQDANIQFKEGCGIEYPFLNSPFTPRVWNGKIYYCAGAVDVQENVLATEKGVHVYPNPFSSSATVVIEGADIQHGADFILFDMFGRQIKNVKLQTSNFEFERNKLPAGVYFYRVNDVSGMVGAGKLVIE